ncbi:MAG: Dihydrolipoyllysine-residue succinyltransferase component of 2-oxoglutarate dehydrogenase complex [Candidatus Midichloria mitochondrii]|nr:2-oxoglutarate dehydrogenase complex dihydrolipoyllysine-residue succinyltransferase [Candidatus Midichloria mitochondrii]MDJ1287969.1 2-oxoglutarate dehydrogenase complex dihydrolipoyllysine-residue succinyltransferase [Candidatus Midichloria mitochondrii]MDJ1298494.1 2-oxoglutarate dehydrogenase complex dihydrolipoyllysine-residue succinyltransferase [Candidatus Midichloria mitochondrii]MDJ1312646.1 2-oxoglutarate dehydrogenase complex dihydrolipoyllysine-residue succinyltransferase [Candid
MSVNIVVPPLGESVTEATVLEWRKKNGEAVKVDEILLELETDKITLEVTAPSAGVISEILAADGATVKVNQVLGVIDEKAVASTPSVPKSSPTTASGVPVKTEKFPTASPAATKLAADNRVDLSTISGTGRDGRITKGDVMMQHPSSSPTLTASSAIDSSARETRVKMSRLRKTIAARLKDSQNTAAILTTFNEVNMSAIIQARQTYQEKFQKKHGIKLGFMSFFVKAVIQALKEIPAVNAEINGDDIIYKNYYDIGVAVGTENGLVVPVVRDADSLSFAEIEKTIANLGQKAKESKLSIADMSGGTFSITNGGIYGSMLSTPIINPPQSAILGMHNIVERPYVVKGQIVVRPIMYIALSYDHRIIDGKEAVTFLFRIKEMIETPERLLFDI